MTEATDTDIATQIESLRQEHHNLEHRLADLQRDPLVDDLEIQEIKKQKLQLKDSIFQMEQQLQH